MIFSSVSPAKTGAEAWFEDMSLSLTAISRQPGGMRREIRQAVRLAEKFNREFVRPRALAMDRRLQEDHDYLPLEWVEEANRRGFFTMCIPRMLGGRGVCFPALSYFMEEIASECLGMANVIGAHYLGLGTLIVTWNMPLMARVCDEIVSGEKSGQACLVSLAMTEPTSGSDTPEPELLDKGTVNCHAGKVAGGYRVNGSKLFISNGHFSTWHITVAFEDLKRPADSGVVLAVKTGSPGFKIGGKESKMGQLACPASELFFNDCFVPDDQVALCADHTRGYHRTGRQIYQRLFDDLCSISRAGICALSAGAARGAYQDALAFAAGASGRDGALINAEWVQCRLADLYRNAVMTRLLYVETNYANGLYGVYRQLQSKPAYYALKYLPAGLSRRLTRAVIQQDRLTRFMRRMQLDRYNAAQVQRTAGMAALAKFAGSDLAVENCQKALEIMDRAGLRHASGAEKRLRDAKLLQIYEGTNQINRLDLFRHLIGRGLPQVRLHEDAAGRSCDHGKK
ncbi:MAG: acyl-CoA dehydrogenase family protein [Thermodesulfobacteriota bacterium]